MHSKNSNIRHDPIIKIHIRIHTYAYINICVYMYIYICMHYIDIALFMHQSVSYTENWTQMNIRHISKPARHGKQPR